MTLRERHYGRHYFKAFRLMREGLLLGGLLNNVESWININQKDLEALEKPDVISMRKVLSSSGNPCKTFMMLELGILPVKFVIMKKRLQFLHYILNENTTSMIRQVFSALEKDSRKGDFISLTNEDKINLDIELHNTEIQTMSKWKWKSYIKKKVKSAALKSLVYENSSMKKTRNINFSSLDMSQYLRENVKLSLTKIVFSLRSKTIDIKEYQPWKYSDDKCVKCKKG